jgi:hypothetical protein
MTHSSRSTRDHLSAQTRHGGACGHDQPDQCSPVIIHFERLFHQPGRHRWRRRVRLRRLLLRPLSRPGRVRLIQSQRTAALSVPLTIEWICRTVEAAIGLHTWGAHFAALAVLPYLLVLDERPPVTSHSAAPQFGVKPSSIRVVSLLIGASPSAG